MLISLRDKLNKATSQSISLVHCKLQNFQGAFGKAITDEGNVELNKALYTHLLEPPSGNEVFATSLC